MIDVNTTQEVAYHDDPQHYANIISTRYVLVSTVETLTAYSPTDSTCQAASDRKVPPPPVTLSLPWLGLHTTAILERRFPSFILVRFSLFILISQMTPLPFRIRSSSSSSGGENTDISLCSNIGTIILALVLILCSRNFSFVVLVSFIDISNLIDRLSFFHWGFSFVVLIGFIDISNLIHRLSFFHWGFSFVVLIGFIDISNLIHRLSFLLWWGHIWNFTHAFNRSFIFLGFSFSFLEGIFVLFFTFQRDICVLVLLLAVFRCSFFRSLFFLFVIIRFFCFLHFNIFLFLFHFLWGFIFFGFFVFFVLL
ncbi:hypothetical protein HanXRQr2_Chr06g0264571 [Helianthus annuus]|uniref:Uncharacterized protein n=1 Tax=Helianthus annuus TaxID=4232 RepID=A0A9K3NKD6_HELAN|nr:hypothetical protein HanXRQr2_Chr06g0264571 [Helianthus annuus]KAJ0915892.1 hypothetical protein HanPSC8_Chr06g0255141 [Helianthus annuus]